MMRSLLAAAIAAAVIIPVGAADAGPGYYHKKRHHYYRSGPYYRGYPMWRAPVYMGTPGPRWSGPNRCWQDLGYGRYESCD